jgi:hypothetical protein
VEQDRIRLTGVRNDGRSLGINKLSVARTESSRLGCYLLVHSSLVGVEETVFLVDDFQVRRSIEPFVFGIEWLQ